MDALYSENKKEMPKADGRTYGREQKLQTQN